MYSCNGIPINHESPSSAETFVTRMIARGLALIDAGLEPPLFMVNLFTRRYWGHARDYVEMERRMLQQEQPDNFVIASGRQESVCRFNELSGVALGRAEHSSSPAIVREVAGLEEVGRRAVTGTMVVRIDPRYYRPAKVDTLLGDPSRAHEPLGRTPTTTLSELVAEMVAGGRETPRKRLT
jgi:GDPmannose 4,6-dehydratase